MPEYDKEMKGQLFINTPKEGKTLKEKAPQMKGTVTINGKEWAISGWSKTSDKAGKYLSLKISEPFKPQSQSQSPEPQEEEELPF